VQAAADVYTRMPHLLLYRQRLIKQKTESLAASLGLPPARVARLTLRYPRLLTYSAETMQQRVQGLRELLQLKSEWKLQRLVVDQPSLLHRQTDTLAGGEAVQAVQVLHW